MFNPNDQQNGAAPGQTNPLQPGQNGLNPTGAGTPGQPGACMAWATPGYAHRDWQLGSHSSRSAVAGSTAKALRVGM